MGFIAAYKRLEMLCGEVMNDERRVSAYIDEMYRLSNGRLYVRSWDEDLKNLKHCRWLRNQIVHEPGCTEQNMCNPADEQWVNAFYTRIMKGTDPLTLYRKATHKNVRGNKVTDDYPAYHAGRLNGCIAAAIIALVLLLAAVILGVTYFLR